ncbi:hypothetical protein MA16_Dca028853 [Dendrobium catenatum]|uniref:Uncharacterized protein n=1 Tax=Dendrobium catenatum TaxID=906689 RepID=A0A2I0V6Q8_9ASPA|nr:hypothetical protein MA16_Dca028853 [Dendrobium catenatum]
MKKEISIRVLLQQVLNNRRTCELEPPCSANQTDGDPRRPIRGIRQWEKFGGRERLEGFERRECKERVDDAAVVGDEGDEKEEKGCEREEEDPGRVEIRDPVSGDGGDSLDGHWS